VLIMGKKFETEILHGGKKSNSKISSKVAPIYQTSAFSFKDLDELEGFYHGNGQYLYSRVGKISVGIEHADDIIGQFEHAIEKSI